MPLEAFHSRVLLLPQEGDSMFQSMSTLNINDTAVNIQRVRPAASHCFSPRCACPYLVQLSPPVWQPAYALMRLRMRRRSSFNLWCS